MALREGNEWSHEWAHPEKNRRKRKPGGERHGQSESSSFSRPLALYFFPFVALFCATFSQAISLKIDPALEFSFHETIEPRLRLNSGIDFNQSQGLCPDQLSIQFEAFNQYFYIILHRNKNLLSSNYFEKHHENGTSVVRKPNNNQNHCHYQGKLRNSSSAWAALSTYNGSVNGVVGDSHQIYYIHFDKTRNKHLLLRGSDLRTEKICGFLDKSPPHMSHLRERRAAPTVQEPYGSNVKSRYVELVIVNDYREFKENNRDKNLVIEKSKQIANVVNGLYNQLNIFIALVGVIIWSDYDEITLSPDGDATLTNFLHYRRERLVPQHPNDNAQLITGASFDGGVVGKALKGPICTYEYSGGVNTDHSHVIGLVATTVAHELGHNFGMEHDTDKCKCPDDKCIMAPSSSSTSPKHWSSCSKEYLEHAFKHGMDYCLRNLPREGFVAPTCGNGFLEKGEECDCGLEQDCDNNCCNATSCTLKPGAKCASGQCCDKSSCTIISKSKERPCREAVDECDLPEFCDGSNEFCPRNVYNQDATDCDHGNGHCFSGRCNTHERQCHLLWGTSGRMSDPKCYEQNARGNVNGNCGYNRLNQTYKACKSADVICGMLHCTHLNERLEFGMESAAILSRSFIPTRDGKILTCRAAIVDLGLDNRDPGLVPNGAKCGTEKMCVNQECVAVKPLLAINGCPNDCNGNGFCDNLGECHCLSGFASPYCQYPVPIGYHLTLALYIIFLCVLPLTAVSAFLVYNYNEHIKTWWLMKVRKASIKTRAKQSAQRKPPRLPPNFDVRDLEISGPIPIEEPSFATLPRSSKKGGHRASFRNVDISAPVQLQFTRTSLSDTLHPQPVRPAPPPPTRTHAFPVSSMTRSSSIRSSTRSHGERPLSMPPPPPRPNCPPPPRPPPPKSSALHQNFCQVDGDPQPMLNFENTRLAFVHESDHEEPQLASNGSPVCYDNNGTISGKPVAKIGPNTWGKKSPAPAIPYKRSERRSSSIGQNQSSRLLNDVQYLPTSSSKVSSLTQKFERS